MLVVAVAGRSATRMRFGTLVTGRSATRTRFGTLVAGCSASERWMEYVETNSVLVEFELYI